MERLWWGDSEVCMQLYFYWLNLVGELSVLEGWVDTADTGTLPTWRMAICMKHSSGGDPICLLDTFIFNCFFSSFWTLGNHISFETIPNQLLCSLPNNHNKMSTKGWSLGPIERKNPPKWRSWIERIKWKTHAKQGLNSNTCWMDKYNWGFSPPTKSLLIMMNGNITQKLFWCFDVIF